MTTETENNTSEASSLHSLHSLGSGTPDKSGASDEELARSGVGGMEYATCTLCASVESSGFYTDCMITDGQCKETGWACDGKGNLLRPVGAEWRESNGESQSRAGSTTEKISDDGPSLATETEKP